MIFGIMGSREIAAGLEESWSVEAADPECKELELRWSFGDGESGVGNRVQHVYSRAGRYKLSVTAAAADGRTQHRDMALEVVVPPPPQPVRATQTQAAEPNEEASSRPE